MLSVGILVSIKLLVLLLFLNAFDSSRVATVKSFQIPLFYAVLL